MIQLLNESDNLQDIILLKTACEQYKEHLKFVVLLITAKEKNVSSLPKSSNINMQREKEKKILMHLIDSERKLSQEEAVEIKAILVKNFLLFLLLYSRSSEFYTVLVPYRSVPYPCDFRVPF